MSDFISRKATLKHIEKIRQDVLMMDDLHRAGIIMNGMDLCEEAVRNQPSADVAKVRHGHWIHDGLDIPHGVDWMHCSECGNRNVYCPSAITNYCPNCGADMRGE